jgi:hypothetical protein
VSWDAWLTDDRGHPEGDWNYTHNCNGMANAVLYEDWDEATTTWNEVFHPSPDKPSWWRVLNGMSGHDGAMVLTRIIKGLEAEPARFRAMNPDNGWGDYDSFLKVLTDMRDRVPENWPSVWGTSG